MGFQVIQASYIYSSEGSPAQSSQDQIRDKKNNKKIRRSQHAGMLLITAVRSVQMMGEVWESFGKRGKRPECVGERRKPYQ